MNYTYVKDENRKVTDILVNEKPIKRGSMRGFRKAQTTSYFMLIDEKNWYYNPFSYEAVELNGLEGTIYVFCLNWYERYSRAAEAMPFGEAHGNIITDITEVPVQTYDDMKYFLLELNPDAYRALID